MNGSVSTLHFMYSNTCSILIDCPKLHQPGAGREATDAPKLNNILWLSRTWALNKISVFEQNSFMIDYYNLHPFWWSIITTYTRFCDRVLQPTPVLVIEYYNLHPFWWSSITTYTHFGDRILQPTPVLVIEYYNLHPFWWSSITTYTRLDDPSVELFIEVLNY